MFSKKLIASLVGSTLATLIAATALNASAQVPTGYPADYAKVIEGAKKEGKLVIYSATDSKAAEPLIKDFSALYPGISVEYNDMNSTEVYNRFISERAAGGTERLREVPELRVVLAVLRDQHEADTRLLDVVGGDLALELVGFLREHTHHVGVALRDLVAGQQALVVDDRDRLVGRAEGFVLPHRPAGQALGLGRCVGECGAVADELDLQVHRRAPQH